MRKLKTIPEMNKQLTAQTLAKQQPSCGFCFCHTYQCEGNELKSVGQSRVSLENMTAMSNIGW